MLGFNTPAHAVPQEYVIMAVGVDESRPKAESYAMNYAKARALFLAATKMGEKNAEEKIRKLTPEQQAQVIRGVTIDQTRREQDRSYQMIRVTVAEDQLRRLFELKQPAPEAEPAKTHSVLVVPALVGPSRMWVWDKENLLRAPLGEEVLRQSRGKVMMPSGDLQDLRLIDDKNAENVKADELKTMFERYGAEEIIITIVSPGAEGTSDVTRILLHRVTPTRIRNEVIELPPESEQDTLQQRVRAAARAVAAAATQIASSSADSEQEKLDKATKIQVQFVYTTARDLARMQELIRSTSGVLRLDLPEIGLKNVKGLIYLEGADKEALRKQLAAKGVVVRDRDGEWSVATR